MGRCQQQSEGIGLARRSAQGGPVGGAQVQVPSGFQLPAQMKLRGTVHWGTKC